MALINCQQCGQLISDKAERCPKCGTPVERKSYCSECGAAMKTTDEACSSCGCPNPLSGNTRSQKPDTDFLSTGTSGKSRFAFALLALFVGWLGIHLFYVGKSGAGIVNILCCTIGILFIFPPIIIGAIGIAQTILSLSMSQKDFEERYVYSDSFYPI